MDKEHPRDYSAKKLLEIKNRVLDYSMYDTVKEVMKGVEKSNDLIQLHLMLQIQIGMFDALTVMFRNIDSRLEKLENNVKQFKDRHNLSLSVSSTDSVSSLQNGNGDDTILRDVSK